MHHLRLVSVTDEPEYGDGDDDTEKLVCPNCDSADFELEANEDDEEAIVVCKNCGQEVGSIPLED